MKKRGILRLANVVPWFLLFSTLSLSLSLACYRLQSELEQLAESSKKQERRWYPCIQLHDFLWSKSFLAYARPPKHTGDMLKLARWLRIVQENFSEPSFQQLARKRLQSRKPHLQRVGGLRNKWTILWLNSVLEDAMGRKGRYSYIWNSVV